MAEIAKTLESELKEMKLPKVNEQKTVFGSSSSNKAIEQLKKDIEEDFADLEFTNEEKQELTKDDLGNITIKNDKEKEEQVHILDLIELDGEGEWVETKKYRKNRKRIDKAIKDRFSKKSKSKLEDLLADEEETSDEKPSKKRILVWVIIAALVVIMLPFILRSIRRR